MRTWGTTDGFTLPRRPRELSRQGGSMRRADVRFLLHREGSLESTPTNQRNGETPMSSSKRQSQAPRCQVPGCGEPEDYHLHRPASECKGCRCPRDHHDFEPPAEKKPKAARVPKLSAREQEKQDARDELRKILSPGMTVQCVLRHVSRSGMQRVIDLFTMTTDDGNGRPWLRPIGSLAACAMGDRYDFKRGGIVVGGCGMDMGFHLVYSLGHALWPGGYGCIGEKCRSNDHSNGDRDYTPHGTPCPDRSWPGCTEVHWHRDGGYALRNEWV